MLALLVAVAGSISAAYASVPAVGSPCNAPDVAQGCLSASQCPNASAYDQDCKLVSRYEMTNSPDSTVSSNGATTGTIICCPKDCHREMTDGVVCKSKSNVKNYDECVAAGNPVMESFPPKCTDPITGTMYTAIATPGTTGSTSSRANFFVVPIMLQVFITAMAVAQAVAMSH